MSLRSAVASTPPTEDPGECGDRVSRSAVMSSSSASMRSSRAGFRCVKEVRDPRQTHFPAGRRPEGSRDRVDATGQFDGIVTYRRIGALQPAAARLSRLRHCLQWMSSRVIPKGTWSESAAV